VPQRGSVFQRSNGRWIASIRIAGKTIQRYAKTKAEADRLLDQLLREHFQGTLSVPSKVLLSTWVDEWMGQLDLRPSTVRTYRETLALILPEVGHYRIDRLTPALLSLVFGKLAKRKVGARRRQLAHGYLKSSLERAVRLEILARNPMANVQRPEWRAQARTYWTADQANHFVQTCLTSASRWAPLFAVLVSCGLRVSEVLGLRAEDVDLDARVLRVRRAVVWSGQSYSQEDVKTRAAIRDVSLPGAAVQAFQRFGIPSQPDRHIFLTLRGKPPSPSHLREPLHALCLEAGLPPLNPHGLRHVHAALVYGLTKDAYATQRRLGHSDVTTTMRIYAYLLRDDSTTAKALDNLLNGPDGKRERDATT
jgi:integrase